MTWHEKWMDAAYQIAKWSKDPSTKVGAVIVNSDNRRLSEGYNGIPVGVKDLEIRNVRPDKYHWYEHAERNAIYSAARLGHSVMNGIMYVTSFPCSDCARGIIQSGITTLIYDQDDLKRREHWNKNMVISTNMLKEANIKVINFKNL